MPHPIVDENVARFASQQHGFTEPAERMEQQPFFLDARLCEYRVQSIAFDIAGTLLSGNRTDQFDGTEAYSCE